LGVIDRPLKEAEVAVDISLSHVSPGFGSARVRKWTAGPCHFGAGSVTTDVSGLHANERAIVLAGLWRAAPVRHLPVVGADALDDFSTGVCRSGLAAHIVLVVSKRDALGSGPRAQKLFVPVLALGLGVGVAKRVFTTNRVHHFPQAVKTRIAVIVNPGEAEHELRQPEHQQERPHFHRGAQSS